MPSETEPLALHPVRAYRTRQTESRRNGACWRSWTRRPWTPSGSQSRGDGWSFKPAILSACLLQLGASVLLTGAAIRGERRFRLCRVQGDGIAPARSRPRSHPRRRLQPHRRGQPARADAVVQGDRQRLLLPARARRALLHQRHRHRQYGQPQQIRASCRW